MSEQNCTDEQIQEVFEMLDTNGSGRLEMSELCRALNLLGVDLTDEEITTTYRIDDDPESLTAEEFHAFFRDRVESMGIDFQQRVKDALLEFQDADDGTISRETLKEILTARGSNPVSEEEAEELIAECDVDGNGVLDTRELARVLCAVMID